MIRNLKVLLLAAMAMAAFGALNASGAQAAEEFHCSVSPCRFQLNPDGTGTTAHHVFVVKNSLGESVSITCKKLEGDGTIAATTSTDVTLTGLAYKECNANGEEAHIDMNGCEYTFTSANGAPGNATGSQVHVLCPGVAHIEITVTEAATHTTKCIYAVTPQTATGVRYTNIGKESETTTEITATANTTALTVEVLKGTTKPECLIDPTKTPITGTYTTGNTKVTAETDPGEAMANGWWA